MYNISDIGGIQDYLVFDVTKYGDVQLTDHFRANEFKCKDNSRIVIINYTLLTVLEDLRKCLGKAITINSGYRTVAYNSKTSGASPQSQHTLGKAADIKVADKTPLEVYTYLNNKYSDKFGIGIYDTFVHIDVRDKKSRWDYRTKKK